MSWSRSFARTRANSITPRAEWERHRISLVNYFRMSQSLDLPHVPFAGSGPAIAAVVGGHVPIAFTALTPALPQITSGKLRALAVTSKRKSTVLPNVPTAAEAGFAELEGDGWIGVLVPARTSSDIVEMLNRQIKIALESPDVQQRMAHTWL